jgi:hypothetical protein
MEALKMTNKDDVPVGGGGLLAQAPERSPRSAAVAGIVFSLLLATSMLLRSDISYATLLESGVEVLETNAESITWSIRLIPFAGIAFLWFTGVIRDRLGDREDRFFATIFLGSGILFVALLFIEVAVIGALFTSYASAADLMVDSGIFIFGVSLANEILTNFTLRMAAVYMLSIATLWTRARVMPRWANLLTFVLAIGFLFFASEIREARFLFPAWVFVMSAYILIANRRLRPLKAKEAG